MLSFLSLLDDTAVSDIGRGRAEETAISSSAAPSSESGSANGQTSPENSIAASSTNAPPSPVRALRSVQQSSNFLSTPSRSPNQLVPSANPSTAIYTL